MNLVTLDDWTSLWCAAGAQGDPRPRYDRLLQAYAEPQRHYHNLKHIAECLELFAPVRSLARQPVAVEMAIWFHDAVYDPRADDNEEQSALLARRTLSESRNEPGFIETVSRLILVTKKHDVGSNIDAPVLVDVDLAILGQPVKRFQEYETQIRSEYAWVPAAVFSKKRAEILELFLARERIYTTNYFFEKFEAQARLNLNQSLESLAHG